MLRVKNRFLPAPYGITHTGVFIIVSFHVVRALVKTRGVTSYRIDYSSKLPAKDPYDVSVSKFS